MRKKSESALSQLSRGREWGRNEKKKKFTYSNAALRRKGKKGQVKDLRRCCRDGVYATGKHFLRPASRVSKDGGTKGEKGKIACFVIYEKRKKKSGKLAGMYDRCRARKEREGELWFPLPRHGEGKKKKCLGIH